MYLANDFFRQKTYWSHSCAASVCSIEAHQVSLRDSQLLRSEEKTALALLRGSGGFIYTERRDVILGYLQKE